MSGEGRLDRSINPPMASTIVKDLIAKKIIRHAPYPSNLFQLLSVLPRDGVGAKVMPESWMAYRGTHPSSFYTITHVRLTPVDILKSV